MILGRRRLYRLTSIRLFESLRSSSGSSSSGSSSVHLRPEIVQATVSACSSDTIALSFFLWCARQPNYFHDPRSFDRMIPVVCRLTDRFGSVREIVRELEEVGCSIKAQTFMVLIRVYWRGECYRSALEAFDEMIKRNYVPNTFARNMVLDILFKTRNLDVAMEFFGGTESPNFLSYNIMLSNLCRLSHWLEARDVLRKMVEKGFDFNSGTLTVVFDFLSKARNLKDLLQLLAFTIVSGKQLTVTIWTILINDLCEVGKVDRASVLLEKMVGHGCSPTVATYTCVIRGLFRAQKFDKVSVILDVMLSTKCSPDLVFYNVLIDCFAKLRRYDDAIEVFLSLKGMKLNPDAYTLSSLLFTLCSGRKLRNLPKLIDGLDVSVDLVACGSLISAFCKAGFPSQAIEVFVKMMDRGFSPDSYSYAGLINGLCISGRIERAVGVYHSILANTANIDAYVHTAIVAGLVKEKEYRTAIQLFRNAVLQDYHLDVVSYTVAITGLFRGCRYEEARSLFDQMKHSGVLPNICTYNVMLYGYCKARDVDAVKQLLREMEIAGFDVDDISFNTIIRLLIKLQRSNSALILCQRMCDLGMMPDRRTYSLLLDGKPDVRFPELTCRSNGLTIVECCSSDVENELVCSAN
ncbi:putative pentatricopeptide repeat-containing protein At1g16830 [Zingiber officinale]|uniref:Pentatricopeptide repeat-containing protein n=1 Tax=Zingiber officinale TaxID=94328 RepID=A0A8J5GJF4_ZINOF|nr:putative pentatricopeptide repeat-containing protein At1g16830 [Zingiber officinale]KAG6507421.1 hypothetical protein ZIOFF_032765 [Zingiber officinale]